MTTSIESAATTLRAPGIEFEFDEAQLAAVSFLARFVGCSPQVGVRLCVTRPSVVCPAVCASVIVIARLVQPAALLVCDGSLKGPLALFLVGSVSAHLPMEEELHGAAGTDRHAGGGDGAPCCRAR